MSLPEPDFIPRDPQVITTELVAQYEKLSGKTLYPAQVERLLIDVIAYRETLVRIGIQEAAKQNLVAFARAPMLDYLGELVGVTRLPAQSARTTLRFSLKEALGVPLLIPAGSRVESSGSGVPFMTDGDVLLPAGQTSIDVVATCGTPGLIGNNWQPGQISQLAETFGEADVAAVNIVVSGGGADAEDDERLRERIKLAPESFSNAGSRLAYRFHAMKAHQNIVDVAVLSPAPGEVCLYPLLSTGLPDANVLAQVEATCSDERVRPLTDHVEALAPQRVDYAIDAQLVLRDDSDAVSVKALAMAKAQAYQAERAAGLGRDVVPSQLIAALQVAGVYQVVLVAPLLKTLAAHEWAYCTGIKLTVTELAHG